MVLTKMPLCAVLTLGCSWSVFATGGRDAPPSTRSRAISIPSRHDPSWIEDRIKQIVEKFGVNEDTKTTKDQLLYLGRWWGRLGGSAKVLEARKAELIAFLVNCLCKSKEQGLNIAECQKAVSDFYKEFRYKLNHRHSLHREAGGMRSSSPTPGSIPEPLSGGDTSHPRTRGGPGRSRLPPPTPGASSPAYTPLSSDEGMTSYDPPTRGHERGPGRARSPQPTPGAPIDGMPGRVLPYATPYRTRDGSNSPQAYAMEVCNNSNFLDEIIFLPEDNDSCGRSTDTGSESSGDNPRGE